MHIYIYVYIYICLDTYILYNEVLRKSNQVCVFKMAPFGAGENQVPPHVALWRSLSGKVEHRASLCALCRVKGV